MNRYPIEQCALYKCVSIKRLEKILFFEANKSNIAAIKKYFFFQIDKNNGIDKRNITAPARQLKVVQSRVLYLLSKVERPDWLMSGEKGKSYVDNGRRHVNSNYFLTIDIKSFYDNCKREYVFRFFKDRLKCSGDIAGLLTDIVTYGEGIPTGCPTSQMIAYYAYENMFNEIFSAAQKYGCVFTVYVDDMTFSAKEHFDVNALKKEVDCILRRYGHKPKYKKMKYFTKGKAVLITGVVVNKEHKLKVPNKLQKKIYDEFQDIKDVLSEGKTDEEILGGKASLHGQLQAANSIEKGKFPEIKRIVSNIK